MHERPFVAKDDEHTAHLNSGRVLEAVIIAVIVSALTAAVSSMWTVGAMRIELDSVKQSIKETRQDNETKITELKQDVREIRNTIMVPEWKRQRDAQDQGKK